VSRGGAASPLMVESFTSPPPNNSSRARENDSWLVRVGLEGLKEEEGGY